MADFEIEQVLGNDSDHRPARLQHGVGHDTHQTDIPAAVHQAPSLCSEKAAQLGRRAAVRSVGAGTGTAEHTDALMHFAISPRALPCDDGPDSLSAYARPGPSFALPPFNE